MHISDGVLSAPILAAGAAAALVGAAYGLRKLNSDDVIGAAVLSSVFFIASLIHVPIGPAGAHLSLHGLMGIVLGAAAFPALLATLALQSVLFQFGGLTALGVNTLIFAVPAMVCPFIMRIASSKRMQAEKVRFSAAAFLAGAMSTLLSALLAASALAFSDTGFLVAAKALIVAHLPIMVVEGLATMFVVSFLLKVRPEALNGLMKRPESTT